MHMPTFVTSVGVTLLSTLVFAQQISHDLDRGVESGPGQSTTYAWTRGTELPDELNHARIVRAVDWQLASKGLTKVDAGTSPSVYAAYHARFDQDRRVIGFSTGSGSGSRFATMTHEISVGTIAVDIIDPKTTRVLWRGSARRPVDVKAKREVIERAINRTISELFKKYAPGK